MMMMPINDTQLFSVVLAEWMRRHAYDTVAAGPVLGTSGVTVSKWLRGTPCRFERAVRALMTLHDEDRA